MSLISTVKRFGSTPSIAKADLEANYGELVKQIGGTYYASGVSTTQSTGQLNASNFKAEAGITNAFKREPTSHVTLQFHWNTIADGATATQYVVLPVAPFPAAQINTGIVYGGAAGATTTVTLDVALSNNGTSLGTVSSVALAPLINRDAVLANSNAGVARAAAGDVLGVSVTLTNTSAAGQAVYDVHYHISLVYLHTA